MNNGQYLKAERGGFACDERPQAMILFGWLCELCNLMILSAIAMCLKVAQAAQSLKMFEEEKESSHVSG